MVPRAEPFESLTPAPSWRLAHAVAIWFAPHGPVPSVALPSDRETGRPRGFGFVEMASADAATAITALNGHSLEGRALRVNEAQDRATSGSRDGARSGNRY